MRPAAQALAGYYRTQPEVLPLIFAHLGKVDAPGSYCVVDPCAGEGDAVASCLEHIFGAASTRPRLGGKWDSSEKAAVHVEAVVVEMERDRSEAARLRLSPLCPFEVTSLHCDGLAATWRPPTEESRGASILWLNPPYDAVKGKDRLEARFLRRWGSCLATGGVLVLVVPERTLPALSEELTTQYDRVRVLRYPADVYADFGQVVVLGVRRAVAAAALSLPETVDLSTPPLPGDLYVVEAGARHGLDVSAGRFDVAGVLEETTPWCGLAGYDRRTDEHLVGMATRPRPAHVAMALGSGIFNGIRLAASGRPDLLAKAVFERRWADVDVKKDEAGDVTKRTQVERPKLRVTILDMTTGELRELDPGVEATPGVEADATVPLRNFADLLLAYGDSMVSAMRRRCPSLHDGESEEALSPMLRRLFPAQAHAARACLKLIHRSLPALLLGEVGSGKTCVSMQVLLDLHRGDFAAAPTLGFVDAATPRRVDRALVVCPPHLVQNWIDEAAACLPDVPVFALTSIADVEALAASTVPLALAVVSRETAKLGAGVAGVGGGRCPRCGAATAAADKLAGSRARCAATSQRPLDRVAAVAAEFMALARTRRRHRRPYDPASPEWQRLRRRAFAALLRKLVMGTTRMKNSWMSKRNSVDWKTTEAIAAAMTVCGDAATTPRATALLRRVLTSPGQTSMLTKMSGSRVDDQALHTALRALGKWSPAVECGEFLYQNVPTPRRWPLGEYICKQHPRLFQMLIPDEFHEYSTDGSAQERMLHRLCEQIPIVMPLTGSLMNGYAKSLFRNLWAISPNFRESFAYGDANKFAKEYGYQRRVLTGDAARETVSEYGSTTDRVVKREGGERLSEAPGVLPSFVMRHLLPVSVTLQKRDIAADSRMVDHDRVEIAVAPGDHAAGGSLLGHKLVEAVKRDRFDEKLAGKLFGQFAELPSYYDRANADVGNAGPPGRRIFECRYPDDVGGAVVASAGGIDAATLLPKEARLRSTLIAELAEGRNVLVFLWHTELAPRLLRIVRGCGEEAAFLEAKKVKARDRQKWIDDNVVGKRRVMVVNPTCVMTGLNNLIWFSTAWFHENPAVNPFVARQAVGRLDRITQRLEVRVFWPVYEGLQAAMLDLLQAKTAIAQQVDGIDPTAALEMAGGGVGDDASSQQDVGAAVFRLLTKER